MNDAPFPLGLQDHEAYSVPLDQLDPSQPRLFQNQLHFAYFERLRREAPVHFTPDSQFGPYWSITKYNDIVAVDSNNKVFSSAGELGGITIRDRRPEVRRESFIAMDAPRHDDQRKAVSPIVAPQNLARMEAGIRERAGKVLDDLEREEILAECLAYFTRLWNERVNADMQPDLLSMMAHAPATRNMTPDQFLGNLILLIVGGNDTTRNSMSGSVLFMHQHPEEYAKLKANPLILDSAVPEIIRYQTPLSHMRRTALEDQEVGGKLIRKGDKVVMWYCSGNRDETAIENPNEFIIDRKRPRQHLSFGFGIHRCVGNRLAEMQLKIVWEEILKRFDRIEVVGPEKRVFSSFVHGIEDLPVIVHGK
jgi:cytochrome P450